MPRSYSTSNKQDVFAPWENTMNLTNRIPIYRYPKPQIKWISLTKTELETIGFGEMLEGDYIFLKLRLAKIDVIGKSDNNSNLKKKYEVIYGPYWFDRDDYSTQNLKNFAFRGNNEFHVFCVSKKDYDRKLAENSIIGHIPTLNMENLNAILCNDNPGSNDYYMFYYIDFISTILADINEVFEDNKSPISQKILFNKKEKIKLVQSEANLLKYGVYRKPITNKLTLPNGMDPNTDRPETRAIPATTACGWRVPKNT